MMTPETKKHLKHMKEFAAAVDAKLIAEPQNDGSFDLVLYEVNNGRKGEPLVTESDLNDMLESLHAYRGGHINFAQALDNYNHQRENA